MKPTIWVSPDNRYIVALEKVAAVRPEGPNGYVMVVVGTERILLEPASARHFTEAFFCFHSHDQTKPTCTKT